MKHIYAFVALLCAGFCAGAQNSVLINFGSNSCYNTTAPHFSLIKDPLSASPTPLTDCDMTDQLGNFFSKFIAYNPSNNKVYVADIATGETRIWVLDMGLPQNIACPTIPLDPTYSYSYVSNNFEFDNNGNLWSFSDYDTATGQCNIDQFDVNNGTVISTRKVQFPAGHYPTTIMSGDLTILPNGRMFATLGDNPSQLYEITNYTGTSNAVATYLQTLPRNCFGIAYLNGQLEITGIDFGAASCYYFDYNIAANILGDEKPFQVSQGPIDNTSFTPSLGVTKQLVNAVKVNTNTADLTYYIYAKNLGNTIINNINVLDDLEKLYGAGNVSNVKTAFVNNGANLTLNASYNGTTIKEILNSGQNLVNQTSPTNNYSFKVQVTCRVTNLNGITTYMNSAIGTGTIGSEATLSLINIADSSNNGNETVVDPNNNGNAGEIGENVPTPFVFGTLPVHFISVNASLLDKSKAIIRWTVATPTVNADKFTVEYSADGRNWKSIGEVKISNSNQAAYSLQHASLPTGNLYYRIKETDDDGSFLYSRIVLLHNKGNDKGLVILPNPANSYIQVATNLPVSGKAMIEVFDAAGRKVLSKQMLNSTEEINTDKLAAGTYLLKVSNNDDVQTQKLVISH